MPAWPRVSRSPSDRRRLLEKTFPAPNGPFLSLNETERLGQRRFVTATRRLPTPRRGCAPPCPPNAYLCAPSGDRRAPGAAAGAARLPATHATISPRSEPLREPLSAQAPNSGRRTKFFPITAPFYAPFGSCPRLARPVRMLPAEAEGRRDSCPLLERGNANPGSRVGAPRCARPKKMSHPERGAGSGGKKRRGWAARHPGCS